MVNQLNKVNIAEWCVDSGASAHMCSDERAFKSLEKSTTISDSVKLADGRTLSIKGTGIIEFKNDISKFRLKDVQFVPGLQCNLLSVSKLAKSGCSIIFKNEKCEINRYGKNLLTVNSKNDVYKTVPEKYVFKTTYSEKSKCIHEWHKILGHRNLNDVRKMVELSNISINKCTHNDICEICLQCKKTRDPFPQESSTKTSEKLDLIHSDVCGPLQLPTPSGNKYILTLIDDFTRYSHIYLMKQKSDVSGKIIEFVEMMKTQHGKVPKVIRSDRGGEYMDDKLRNYFKSKSIKTKLTVPKTPQQNGVAERKNRTLIEITMHVIELRSS